jgi:glucose/arabinose dehydrogenase
MRRTAAVLALLVVVAACTGTDAKEATPTTVTTTTSAPAAPSTTTTAAAAAAAPSLAAVKLKLTRVGSFDQPLALTWCPGNPQPYVAEKSGKVRTFAGATVLDLSGSISNGSEQGLLGIACAPDAKHLYVAYTNRAGDGRLEEYALRGGVVDRASVRTLVALDDPAPNHNGGGIAFGPDGKLWYGMGDGGGSNDQFNNAQKTTDLFGDMLRLDPASNARPEVVVTGLRNPWRFSFDRATGDLWIGDVGQNTLEEIDKLPAGKIGGANMGWPAFEGTRRLRRDVAAPPGAIPPVFEYGRSQGQSVVGGYVYRGKAIPDLVGAYLFADTYRARLRAIVVPGASTTAQRDFGAVPGGLVSSFAEGPAGELYVLSLDGGIYRLDPG